MARYPHTTLDPASDVTTALEQHDYRSALLGEARTILGRVEEHARRLDPTEGIAQLETMLGHLHSYKSLAAFAHMDAAAHFATEFETYLSELWQGRIPLDARAADLVRRAANTAATVHSAQVTHSLSDYSAILRDIHAATGETTAGQSETSVGADLDATDAPRFGPEPLSTTVESRTLAEMESLAINSSRLLERLRDGLGSRSGERRQMMLLALERNLLQLRQSTHRCRVTTMAALTEPAVESIHRLAQDFGKLVTLEVRGGDVEVDRAIAQILRPSLLHLLRNAVAHGAEDPDTRRAKGKTETTAITVAAENSGGELTLTVADDGCGFDLDALRRTAAANGAVSRERIAATDDEEALQLALVPGVSTSATRNDLSGTGMGLSAVSRDMASLGGSVRLHSTQGSGTVITLLVPLTQR